MTASRWFRTPKPEPSARLSLFCFPYAGGGAQIFRRWQERLPATVAVFPVELPGRGPRMREPAFRNIPALVREMSDAFRPWLDRPFAFFGHSMGSLICFELARLLRSEAGVEPAHLFASASRAPQISHSGQPLHRLSDEGLVESLRHLNGTPSEVLQHPEMMELMLPLLRADFEMIETYEYTDAPPLGCPITVFGGLRDAEAPREKLEGWREHTTGRFRMRMFDGDHFFIHPLESLVLREVAEELRGRLGGGV